MHRLSCSVACGIFLDQGSNPCPLHWQADSQPLHHQGSPTFFFKWIYLFIYLWLCWILIAARRLCLVAASRGYYLWQCVGFSLQWLLLLQSMGSRHMGSPGVLNSELSTLNLQQFVNYDSGFPTPSSGSHRGYCSSMLWFSVYVVSPILETVLCPVTLLYFLYRSRRSYFQFVSCLLTVMMDWQCII